LKKQAIIRHSRCFCGRKVIWKKYMDKGIRNICECGAWQWWDEAGLHISNEVPGPDGDTFVVHMLISPHIFVRRNAG
jgi:hypothetical protein